MGKLDGKVAVITVGSSGPIGKAEIATAAAAAAASAAAAAAETTSGKNRYRNGMVVVRISPSVLASGDAYFASMSRSTYLATTFDQNPLASCINTAIPVP